MWMPRPDYLNAVDSRFYVIVDPDKFWRHNERHIIKILALTVIMGNIFFLDNFRVLKLSCCDRDKFELTYLHSAVE